MESFNKKIYRSQHLQPSWLVRKIPGWYFYPKLIAILRQSASLAKRGKYTSEQWAQVSLQILRLFESLGTKVIIENIAAFQNLDSPCVFIGNHISTLETFVLPAIIQPYRDMTFIVKKSLLEVPAFKHIMRSIDPIVVGRKNPKEDFKAVLENGLERLNRNISIVVFPQTTRSTNIDPKSFNSIGIKLAKRAGVPVIPIALKTDAWGLGSILKDFGKIHPENDIHFCFGDPVTISGNGKKAHQAIVQFISEKLKMWF